MKFGTDLKGKLQKKPPKNQKKKKKQTGATGLRHKWRRGLKQAEFQYCQASDPEQF